MPPEVSSEVEYSPKLQRLLAQQAPPQNTKISTLRSSSSCPYNRGEE